MKVRNLFSVRVRVSLATPKKGDKGDMCDETQVKFTDIPSILRRYAGNLEELMKWRGNLRYEDTTVVPRDYETAFELFRRAQQSFDGLKDNPFASIADAYKAYKDGTFVNAFRKPVKSEKEITHEEAENQSEGE